MSNYFLSYSFTAGTAAIRTTALSAVRTDNLVDFNPRSDDADTSVCKDGVCQITDDFTARLKQKRTQAGA